MRVVVDPPGGSDSSHLRGGSGSGNGGDKTTAGGGGSSGGKDGQLCCPKCGNPCTHVETFVCMNLFQSFYAENQFIFIDSVDTFCEMREMSSLFCCLI